MNWGHHLLPGQTLLTVRKILLMLSWNQFPWHLHLLVVPSGATENSICSIFCVTALQIFEESYQAHCFQCLLLELHKFLSKDLLFFRHSWRLLYEVIVVVPSWRPIGMISCFIAVPCIHGLQIQICPSEHFLIEHSTDISVAIAHAEGNELYAFLISWGAMRGNEGHRCPLQAFVEDLVECEKRKRKKGVKESLALSMAAVFMLM